jgi:hypothetical protein
LDPGFVLFTALKILHIHISPRKQTTNQRHSLLNKLSQFKKKNILLAAVRNFKIWSVSIHTKPFIWFSQKQSSFLWLRARAGLRWCWCFLLWLSYTLCTYVCMYVCQVCMQGCQVVSFPTKNPNLGQFWGPYNGKCLYILWPFGIFTAIWYNLWPFGIVCGHLVYFPILVCLDQEKMATL